MKNMKSIDLKLLDFFNVRAVHFLWQSGIQQLLNVSIDFPEILVIGQSWAPNKIKILKNGGYRLLRGDRTPGSFHTISI